MQDILPYFLFIPLLGLLFAAIVPPKSEKLLSAIALTTAGVQFFLILIFVAMWWSGGGHTYDAKHIELYRSPKFTFTIETIFDRTTAVFATIGAFLTVLVAFFSKFYMHREAGFKRFFVTLQLFFVGYNFVIFAGNFETMFIGWEILGLTSFLLIAFFRDRYLPVKNAFKVLSFYRFADVALLLAMWMCHHLWHKNISFSDLGQAHLVQDIFATHSGGALFFCAMILLAATIKSAQFPFSTWLPRAMEGPTSSSAIFYGSLAINIGAFLLLRTHAFWQHQPLIVYAIIGIGAVTALIATSIGRVQATVKTQIAYASVAQIGLIFIEIAIGWHTLALIHFAGNALMRTYQLLVSPSVLNYLIHDMFFSFTPRKIEQNKLKQSLYILAVKEWNTDHLLMRYLWQPFKWVGKQLTFIEKPAALLSTVLILLVGIGLVFNKDSLNATTLNYLSILFLALAVLLVLSTFSSRDDARKAFLRPILSHFFTITALLFISDISPNQVLIYLTGAVLCGIGGYLVLQKMHNLEGNTQLHQYHGHSYQYPLLGLLFLGCTLGASSFPLTPSFLGTDILLTEISEQQMTLTVLFALHFLFLELCMVRIYCRIFLGQHIKMNHPMAFKSS